MPIPCWRARGAGAAAEVGGARWVNVLLSNLKRSIGRAYHAFKRHKYARRYLAEAAYRFNRRFRLPEFVLRLLRAMVLCTPSPESFPRQATNFSSCGSAPIRQNHGVRSPAPKA
jgi:hypothetical protein